MNAPSTESAHLRLIHSCSARVAWIIAACTLALAVVLVLLECTWLRGRQHARSIALANEQVEARIATARLHLRERRWNEAIRELEEALDVEEATNSDTVYPVWEGARRGQAEALLDAAGIALAHRQPVDTLRLLRAYLAHPQAGQLDRARLLHRDLERALSDEEAARLLTRLTDEELTVFAEKGQLTGEDGLSTESIRALFLETLRRNLPTEVRKREAQHEVARLTAERLEAERARRIARLRATPAFHSLSTFLDQTREQFRDRQQLASRQEAELANLFQALGVTNAAEQEQIRSELQDRRQSVSLREEVERRRAEAKRAYRSEREFNRADGDLFDRLVDREVETLLNLLFSS